MFLSKGVYLETKTETVKENLFLFGSVKTRLIASFLHEWTVTIYQVGKGPKSQWIMT